MLLDYNSFLVFFFFNDTATTEIYTLSLHDALPILEDVLRVYQLPYDRHDPVVGMDEASTQLIGEVTAPVLLHSDRKSTRLNSSHGYISYAVFCLKKKNRLDLIRKEAVEMPALSR